MTDQLLAARDSTAEKAALKTPLQAQAGVSEIMETTGTPAAYGLACQECVRAKCKCVVGEQGEACERYAHDIT